MRRRLASLAPLVLCLVLAAAPDASAAIYCVAPATGCADGSFADVQPALNAAQANAGPDEVRLGATTYETAAGFTYDGGPAAANSVIVSGAGRAATTLTRSTNGAILLLQGAARHTVGDLRLHIVTGGTTPSFGLQGGSGDAFRIDVDADPSVANSEGIQLGPGSVHDAHVSMATSGGTIGVIAGGASGTDGVFDSTVVADKAVSVFQGTVQRTRISAGQSGIEQRDGTIDDVSVRLVGTGRFGNVGLRAVTDFVAMGGTLTARHLTIVGSGQAVSTGVLLGTDVGAVTLTVNLRNSIVRGVARSFQRFGGSGGFNGIANLSILYSDYDPTTGSQSGFGTGPDLTDLRNVDADPRFVDLAGGDLRLRGGSPAIDAGDPAGLSVSEPLVDLGGAPRVVDGNGDGIARQDMGAFEHQRRAPVLTSATAAPASATSGTPVAFAASASDPDGDDVALSWSFDDGGSAAGQNIAHAFAAAGAHVATVTATDSAGVSASAQVGVTVTGGGAAASGAITALSVAPTAFRSAASGPSAVATASGGVRVGQVPSATTTADRLPRANATARRRAARPAATGATVRFTLSAAGSVRFTVERVKGGRKVRGRCVAPRRGNRAARRCVRSVAVGGSFTRAGTAGSNSFRFSGRLNGKALAPGSYRLVGTAGAQSVRRAAFAIKRPPPRRAR